MKKSSLLIIGALALTACQNKPGTDPIVPEPLAANDIIIMNNGNWGSNDACITVYNIEAQNAEGNVFEAVNGKKMGDLAQDILRLGDNYYIAMTGSHLIYITDTDLKIIKEIPLTNGDVAMSPRSFATDGKLVYFTCQEGLLARMNPEDNFSISYTEVGPNPEGVAYSEGKLYVANSGGYVPGFNNTVSVVDAESFKETSTITVNCNPKDVVANSKGTVIYVSSLGNYADIPAKLQIINPKTGFVEETEYEGVNGIALGYNDVLYILCGEYDANWTLTGTVYAHNALKDLKMGVIAKDITNAYSISADKAQDYVFVGVSDYKSFGDMLIYKDSELYDTVDAIGLNPQKAVLR